MKKAIGLLLSIASSLSVPLAAQSARANALEANMYVLQVLLETYAVESGGIYPKNITDLIKEAKDQHYYKDITNPYSGAQGFNAAIADGLAKAGCKAGVVYYQTPATPGLKDAIPDSTYEISACLMGQQPIMANGKPFVISNIKPKKSSVPSAELQTAELEKALSNLKSSDAETRYAAIQAFDTLQDERAVLPLIETLKDEDERVRVLAVLTLFGIGDQRAVPPLIEVFKDEDESFRVYAVEALEKLGH